MLGESGSKAKQSPLLVNVNVHVEAMRCRRHVTINETHHRNIAAVDIKACAQWPDCFSWCNVSCTNKSQATSSCKHSQCTRSLLAVMAAYKSDTDLKDQLCALVLGIEVLNTHLGSLRCRFSQVHHMEYGLVLLGLHCFLRLSHALSFEAVPGLSCFLRAAPHGDISVHGLMLLSH